MVSYADFMTLLFAFFVVLYSSSQVDKKKMASLSDAIRSGFSSLGVGSGPASVVLPAAVQLSAPARSAIGDSEAIRRKLEASLAEELKRQHVVLRQTPEGIVVSLREVGFFESGSATLQTSSLETFDRLGAVLSPIGVNIRIEGHTDNRPIHTSQFQSNWELSAARATEIIRIFLTRENIDPTRLSASGFAEFHPIADNATDEGRRANRRVDLVILTPGAVPAPASLLVPMPTINHSAAAPTAPAVKLTPHPAD